MNGSLLVYSLATMAMASLTIPAAAQNRQVSPGGLQAKEVQVGYGLDKDQPFAGADPDGTGLPFKEPPA